MKFSDYLAKRRMSGGPGDEFTREARTDPAMAEIESWPALQSHLFRRHGEKVKDAIHAADPVWRGYRAHVLKTRRRQK